MSLKEKRTALQQHLTATKTLYRELAEKEQAHKEDPEQNPAVTGEERTQLNAMIDAGKVLREELETAEELARQDDLVNCPDGELRSREGQPARQVKRWGEVVVGSEQFKIAHDLKAKQMDRVKVPGGIATIQRKAIYGSDDAQGGVFVNKEPDKALRVCR